MVKSPSRLTLHPLAKEVAEERKDRLKISAKTLLIKVEAYMAQRARWIERRQSQIKLLGTIAEDIYTAYDNADEKAMEHLKSEVDNITNGQSWGHDKSPDRTPGYGKPTRKGPYSDQGHNYYDDTLDG